MKNINDKKTKVMLGIFILLVILVVSLFKYILVLNVNSKNEKEANIVIPLIEDNAKSSIKVTIDKIKTGEYIFKVSNYRKSTVNKKDVNYTIKVTNEDEIDYKLYKNDSEKDLNTKEKSFEIKDNKLKAKEKCIDTYIIKINNKNKKSGYISIDVSS